jgi:sulfate adenylyltransferase subunit 1
VVRIKASRCNFPARDRIEAIWCWLHRDSLSEKSYLLRVGTFETSCVVTPSGIVNINSGEEEPLTANVALNDIVRCTIETVTLVAIESYYSNRYTGSMILIDPSTGETCAAAVAV